jgi:hypothetical protein
LTEFKVAELRVLPSLIANESTTDEWLKVAIFESVTKQNLDTWYLPFAAGTYLSYTGTSESYEPQATRAAVLPDQYSIKNCEADFESFYKFPVAAERELRRNNFVSSPTRPASQVLALCMRCHSDGNLGRRIDFTSAEFLMVNDIIEKTRFRFSSEAKTLGQQMPPMLDLTDKEKANFLKYLQSIQ